jgi:hypothetical protein
VRHLQHFSLNALLAQDRQVLADSLRTLPAQRGVEIDLFFLQMLLKNSSTATSTAVRNLL